MKRTIVLAILLTCLSLGVYSAEPKNNLFKTLPELRTTFPDLKLWSNQGSYQMYTSDGVFFDVKDNRVFAEYMLVEGEGFAYDWFCAMRNSLKNTSYRYITEDKPTIFEVMYSTFTIRISYDSYPKPQSMITYEVLGKYKW